MPRMCDPQGSSVSPWLTPEFMEALIEVCEAHLGRQHTVLWGEFFDLVEGGVRAPAEWLAEEVAAVLSLVQPQ